MSKIAFSRFHKPSRRKSVWSLLSLSLLSLTACDQYKLRKEMAQNPYFSEILKREDRRSMGEDAFFEKALLSNPDPEVRRWAATGLGRIGSPRALPLLGKALYTGDATIRAASAFAIGEIESKDSMEAQSLDPDPNAVSELRRLLDDKSLVVRMRATEALGKIGSPAEAFGIIKRLEQFVYNGQPVERAYIVASITALARLSNPSAAAILEKYAGTADPEFQWRSLDALVRLQSKGSRDLFIRNLENSNALVRSYAAKGIGMMGEPALAKHLIPLLASPAQQNREPLPLQVRTSALQALGEIRDPGVIPHIESAIGAFPIDRAHPDQQNFAAEAALTLGSFGSERAEPPLLQLLRYPGAIADNAILSLAGILKADPDRFFSLAAKHEFAGKASLRAWTQALGEMGGAAAIGELTRLLAAEAEKNKITDMDALPEIFNALAKAGAPEARTILAPFFKSRDAAIARAALSTYEPNMGSKAPWAPILEALAVTVSNSNSEARAGLVGYLKPWIQEATVQQALRAGLSDFDYDVRLACAALLRKAGASGIPEEIPANRSITDETCNALASSRTHVTIARIETDRGAMEVELFQEDAPVTSARFALLAEGGAYDGMEFDRLFSGHRIEGEKLVSRKDSGLRIHKEINMRPFKRGSVGMATAGNKSDAGKLFIVLDPLPYLDGIYTCFGHVVSGIQIADTIASGDRIRHITIKQTYPYVKSSDPSESTWHPLRGKGKLPK